MTATAATSSSAVGVEALRADALSVEYVRNRRRIRAVDSVSLAIAAGETLGLVGESGSGKTSFARAALGLLTPSAGSISVGGCEVRPGRKMRRQQFIQAVFQSPYSSLDPAQKVRQIVAEPLLARRLSREQIDARVRAALEDVGLDWSAAASTPGRFSGGQRQRIAIARALVAEPRLIVFDEPTTALDLSIQAQIVNLLLDLQERHRMSYLVIGHDLGLVNHLSDRIAVMYRGHLLETGPATSVYSFPRHPYTQALFEAEPVADPALQRRRRAERIARRRIVEARDTARTGPGCPYVATCPHAMDRCLVERPSLRRVDDVEVACHLFDSGAHAPP
jgi:peptide/nickel transport system ATP-binding protein